MLSLVHKMSSEQITMKTASLIPEGPVTSGWLAEVRSWFKGNIRSAFQGIQGNHRVESTKEDAYVSIEEQFVAKIQKGTSAYSQGDLSRAIQLFSAAIALKPLSADAYYYRGLARSHRNDFEAAIEDFTLAVCIEPDNLLIYHSRANAYAKMGDTESALKDLSEATRLNPPVASSEAIDEQAEEVA